MKTIFDENFHKTVEIYRKAIQERCADLGEFSTYVFVLGCEWSARQTMPLKSIQDKCAWEVAIELERIRTEVDAKGFADAIEIIYDFVKNQL